MRKQRLYVSVVLILLLLSFLVSLMWGSYEISFPDLIRTLMGEGTNLQNMAIFQIRLPRMIVGVFVAMALAVSGGILQTITKNELADPGIIGINAGGAVAAVLFIQFSTAEYYTELGSGSIYVLPFFAILGSALAATFIYMMSCHKGLRPKRMLLMGIGVNAGLTAVTTFVTYSGSVGEYNRVLVWTTGSLWGSGWDYVIVLVPIVILVILYIFWKTRILDAMSFTDETAIGLGIEVNKERTKIIAAAVILAGAATAFAGNIGFLGLVAPHIARRIVGVKHKLFLPLAAAIAAAIILIADAVGRNAFSPLEIPAGIMVSIIGVPYFIYLMLKESDD